MYDKICDSSKAKSSHQFNSVNSGRFQSAKHKASKHQRSGTQCQISNKSSLYTDSRSCSRNQERSISAKMQRKDLRRADSSNLDLAEYLDDSHNTRTINDNRRLYISKRASSKIRSPLAQRLTQQKNLRATISSSKSRTRKVESSLLSKRRRQH